MIQRIQSLWLFLAAVALIAVLFLPSGLASLASILAILHFKKRDRQLRWAWSAFLFKTILALGMISMFLYFKFVLDSLVEYGPAVLMPFLGLVLDYLAIKGIKKDDALVKSLDRIR